MIIDQIGTPIKEGDSVAVAVNNIMMTGTVLQVQDNGIVIAMAFPVKSDLPCGGLVKTFEQPKKMGIVS